MDICSMEPAQKMAEAAGAKVAEDRRLLEDIRAAAGAKRQLKQVPAFAEMGSFPAK